jgi:hypothetical protein
VLGAFTTVVWELAGIVPELVNLGRIGPDVATTHALLPAVATEVFALVWIGASLVFGRGDREASGRDSDKLLGAVLGLTLALGGVAALSPVFEPHGAAGRVTTKIYRAGGGTHTVTVVRVVSPPRDTGVELNHQRLYTSDVLVDVPFADRSRDVAVSGVRIAGPNLAVGDEVQVVYAPTRPDLGAQTTGAGDLVEIFGFGLLIFCTGPCLGLTIGGATQQRLVSGLRRFRPGLHLPVMALLLVAAGSDAVVDYGFPGAPVSWLLTFAAFALLGCAALLAVLLGQEP